MNLIEAVWDHLDREINKRQLKSKEELWEVLKEARYNIPEDYFRKLQALELERPWKAFKREKKKRKKKNSNTFSKKNVMRD